MGEKYEQAKAGRYAGERNDCTVIAVSIACRVPYNKAHAALGSYGRKRGRGANSTQWLGACRYLGCQWEQVNVGTQPNGSGWTGCTIGRRFPRGYYLVRFRGHLAAMVNGKVEDWTDGKRNRVIDVYRVTVPRGSRS